MKAKPLVSTRIKKALFEEKKDLKEEEAKLRATMNDCRRRIDAIKERLEQIRDAEIDAYIKAVEKLRQSAATVQEYLDGGGALEQPA